MMNLGKKNVWTIALITAALGGVSQTSHAEPLAASRQFGAASCAADVVTRITRPGVVAARTVGAGARQATARPVAQVTRNDRADVTFELRPSADGGVEVSGRSGDLLVKKTVQGTGEFVLELSTGRDKVSVAVSGDGTSVTRGTTTLSQRRSAPSSDIGNRVRRLLAESTAVVRFRTVNAALLDADDRSPASLAFVMADAVIGMMTGDVGAPRRTAQFLAHRGLAKQRPAAMAVDCFALMETRMVEAWYDFGSCYASVSPNSFYQDLCGYRWVLQVESYWFNFLSCSGFNM